MNERSDFIFGKAGLNNIVSCEAVENSLRLFFEKDGVVTHEDFEHEYWLLCNEPFKVNNIKLKGEQHYKYMRLFDTKESLLQYKNTYRNQDLYSIYDDKEAAMLYHGFGYYQGMQVEDVSVLSFDIEATSLMHKTSSKVLLISNTFRRNGKIIEKLFSYDEFTSQGDMINSWCEWVREMNPSIICGHNIFGYDLPYLQFVAKRNDVELLLGRDGSSIRFQKRFSNFRKDGSQSYEFKKAYIFGREIVDTMFVAYHYDYSRKYINYSLKGIIKQEGLEAEDRQHYDASQIAKNYKKKEEWEKIKAYAEHDSRDSLALFDLMIHSYFYFCRSIPKSFQSLNYSATGSQVNSFLIRSYLQDGWSIPKASETEYFEGAISFGIPGIYNNINKLDVVSLYPSIMLQYEIYDERKDPRKNFLKMVEYFTNERLENKKKSKETKDQYYKYLEQSQKIAINSAYGLLGVPGLHFNSPTNAALVTRKGREILKQGIKFATKKDADYWYDLFLEKTGKKEKKYTPTTDGEDHINIYSRGQTEIGRFLSNFTHCPIETIDGHFDSIEGYWYWLLTNNSNKEELRFLSGYEAKKFGRTLVEDGWKIDAKFKNKIKKAIKLKVFNMNNSLFNQFLSLDLPFKHYYVHNENIIQVPKSDWIMKYLEKLRNEMRKEEEKSHRECMEFAMSDYIKYGAS